MAKRCLALLGLAALVCVSLTAFGGDGGNAGRKTIDLMGEWKLLPVMGKELPDEVPTLDTKWQDYKAGTLWSDGKHDSAWLVKEIEIAPEDVGKVFQFRFQSLHYYARLFVNGKKVGEQRGDASVQFHVTVQDGIFKTGKNIIALGMTDSSAALEGDVCTARDLQVIGIRAGQVMDAAKKHQKKISWRSDCKGEALGGGKWFTQIGILEDAGLLILPRVYIDDVFVKTSTRKMRLEADIEVVNSTDKPQKVWVRGRAMDYCKPLLTKDAPTQPAPKEMPEGSKAACELWPVWWTLQPGERKVITVAGSWCDRPQVGLKGPEFWSPEHPKLYWFDTQISTKGEKEPAEDATGARFGFREIWVENCSILLNGHRMFLGGASYTFYSTILSRDAALSLARTMKYKRNFNTIRSHLGLPQRSWLDAADEVGIMTFASPQGSYDCYLAGNGISLPRLESMITDACVAFAKGARNHPAIIVWSTDNETLFTSGMPNLWAPSVPFLIERQKRYRELDQTRIVTSGHEYDLRGVSDVFDAGYNNFPLLGPFPYEMMIHKSYYFPFAQAWDGVKPIWLDECNEGFGQAEASGYFGDIVYSAPFKDISIQSLCVPYMDTVWCRHGQNWSSYAGIMETRKQGIVSTTMLYGGIYIYAEEIPDSEREEIAKQTGKPAPLTRIVSKTPVMIDCMCKNFKSIIAVPSDLYRSYVSGTKITRPYTVINESARQLKGTLKWELSSGKEELAVNEDGIWQLKDGTGKVVEEGAIDVDLPAGARGKYDIVAKLPIADGPEALSLKVSLIENGAEIYRAAQQYSMVPEADFDDSPKFALVGGKVSQMAFKELGANFKPLTPSEAMESGLPIVVGTDAKLELDDWKELEKFVSQGGGILVLARGSLPHFFNGVDIVPSGLNITMSQMRAKQHPVIKGFNMNDGFWWPASDKIGEFNDTLVAINSLRRPMQGNFKILIDAGLGYLNSCEGLTLTPLIETFPGGKGKALFCSLLLEEKASRAPSAALLLKRCLDYIGEDDGAVLKPMSSDICLERVRPELAKPGERLDVSNVAAAMIDGSTGIPSDKAEELVEFAKGGGTVLVHGVKPETAGGIGKIFGVDLSAKPMDVRWVRFHPELDPIFDGMSHFDMAYHVWGTPSWPQNTLLSRTVLSSSSQNVKEVAEPGVLLLQRLGKGRVVYDQVQWDSNELVAYGRNRADGYLIQMLTNAGVKLAPACASSFKPDEWLVLGPFKLDNKVNIRMKPQKVVKLPDETEYVAKEGLVYERTREDGIKETCTWKRAKLNIRDGARDNMNLLYGACDWSRPTWDYYCAYAQVYVDSPEAQDVRFTCGADDAMEVYLNGKKISIRGHTTTKDGEFLFGSVKSDQDAEAKIHLNKGKNRLLVKTTNGLGNWGFITKFMDNKYPLTFSTE